MSGKGNQERRLSAPPESIRPGKLIAGKYQIESLLGTGAMGTVWIATHVNLGSKVAVKLVSPDFAKSAEARTRFLAEAKAAASLRSRYVVQMFDSGVTDDGAPYIVMEYLRGESLEDRIQRTGRIPLEQVVRIVGQVAKGLERAHCRNIVHRDLKPANIFLASTEDGEEVAKILDFGIAKMEHEDKDYKATATGVIMGTPLFMSPEQARGLKSVDDTSDVYSLGMVTYAATVGDVPFHAESFGDLVYMVCTQDIPPTQTVAPWLPPTLDAWFRRVCHKDQTKRFASAKEAYEALVIASQLSRPTVDLASLPDSVGASADTALFDTGGSRITGKIRSTATSASTVPFSSADDVAASWQTDRESGAVPALDTSASPRTSPSPGAAFSGVGSYDGETSGLTTRDGEGLGSGISSTPIPKKSRAGVVIGALLAVAAIGAVIWWASSDEPPVAADTATNTPPDVAAEATPQPQLPQPSGPKVTTSPEPSDEASSPAPKSGTSPQPAKTSAPQIQREKPTTKPKARPRPRPTPKVAIASKPEPKPAPKPAPRPKPQPTAGQIDLGF